MDYQNTYYYLAQTYFEAAIILKNSQPKGPAKTHPERLLPIPIAFLTSHGVELALKSNLLAAGVNENKLRSQQFGHNIWLLWKHKQNTRLVENANIVADEIWNEHGDTEQCSRELLDRILCELSELHGNQSDFALRYGNNGKMKIPKTNFVLDIFKELMLRQWPLLNIS